MAETFTPRTEAPDSSNAYYYDNNPFYASGYGLPNCTCYAWGRFWECQGSSGSRPTLSLNNAEDWYAHSDGYSRGSTPKLGAVLCWRKGALWDDSDGAGHVEIVEAINDDGTIVTSGSAYNGYLFRTKTRSDDGNWSGGDYTFQGFIYNPVEFSGSGGGESGGDSDEPAKWKVVYDGVKIRASASVSSAQLGTLSYGTIVTEEDRVDDGNVIWIKHSQGWTCAQDGGLNITYMEHISGVSGGGNSGGGESSDFVVPDPIMDNRYLTSEEMHSNAVYIWWYLSQRGWTLNAVAGMLGNMQVESTINPGIWESLTDNPQTFYNEYGRYPGYGLVQWTPYTKLTDWADNQGYGNTHMDVQLERIIWEQTNENGQFYSADTQYAGMTFTDFKESTLTPYELGMIFLVCYERPYDPDQPSRGENAEYWYEYLSGININPEEPEVKKKRRTRFNFILFGNKQWRN